MLGFLESLMSSWLLYPLLAGISLIDAIVPVIPSEAPLIMAGVYAANADRPHLWGVIVCAAAGAAAGDHTTYFIGRFAARRWLLGADANSKRARMMTSARLMLEQRGASTLIVARFIPGGRIALNLTMGASRYPLRKYSLFDIIATLIWASYGAAIGYLGGATFEKNPIAGLALGLGVALVVTALSEGCRWWFRRRGHAPGAAAPPPVAPELLPERSAGTGAGIR